jgi:hypothetical protein
MTEIKDIALIVRSKNADPFITTCDIFIRSRQDYEWLKSSGIMRPEIISEAYHFTPSVVLGVFFVDEIWAVKVSFIKSSHGRYTASGDLEEIDLLGAQQHVPLLHLQLPDRRAESQRP